MSIYKSALMDILQSGTECEIFSRTMPDWQAGNIPPSHSVETPSFNSSEKQITSSPEKMLLLPDVQDNAETAVNPLASSPIVTHLPTAQDQSVQPQSPMNIPQPMAVSYDPLAECKSITQHNNTISGQIESHERLLKNQQKVVDSNGINYTREMLYYIKINPLPKTLEVSTSLPLWLLPDAVQELIRAVATGIGVSIEMVFAAWLGAIFIAARGNFKIKINEDWFEAVTAYILCSAASGQRKSAVVEFFRRIFVEIQTELHGDFSKSERRTGRQLLRKALKLKEAKLAKKIENFMDKSVYSMGGVPHQLAAEIELVETAKRELDKDTHPPRLLIDSPTLEKLAIELERNNEILGIFEAEGGFWKSRVRAALDDILLKSYTGESFVAETKTLGSVTLLSPILSICNLIQPGILDELYCNSDLNEHGLIGRILAILAPSYHCGDNVHSAEIPTAMVERYEQMIRSLLNIQRPVGGKGERTFHILKLNGEAKARIEKYGQQIGQQINAGEFDAFPAFGSKLAGHAVRLAGAIHLVTHADPQNQEIGAKTMEAGIAFAEFFQAHAKAAYTPEARNGIKYGEKILNWMKRERCPTFTERDAQRGIGHCNVVAIRAGIDMLERHNYLRRYVNGRSSICVVHPFAYGNQ